MVDGRRLESQEAPESFQRLLWLAGGTNPYGEAMYRLVWGWNRLEWIGGRWTDYDSATGAVLRERFEIRQVPTYWPPAFDPDRFYVERWYPPEHFGSPRQWTAVTREVEGFANNCEAMGLYPRRGDWKHFYTVEGPDCGFRQLTMTRALWLASVVWSSEKLARAKRAETLEMKRQAQREKVERKRQQELEVLDDSIPASNYEPFVSVGAHIAADDSACSAPLAVRNPRI